MIETHHKPWFSEVQNYSLLSKLIQYHSKFYEEALTSLLVYF